MDKLNLAAMLGMAVVMASCSGQYGTMTGMQEESALPPQGNDAQRDGFYDGGVFDPDLSRPKLPLAE